MNLRPTEMASDAAVGHGKGAAVGRGFSAPNWPNPPNGLHRIDGAINLRPTVVGNSVMRQQLPHVCANRER